MIDTDAEDSKHILSRWPKWPTKQPNQPRPQWAQHLRKITKSIVKTAGLSVLCTGLTFAPVAHALQIKLENEFKVRQIKKDGETQDDKQMERVGLLTAGSIIEIPDQYAKTNKKGRVDLQLSLNNWLKNAGTNESDRPGKFTYDGEYSALFFPIKIVHAEKGSSPSLTGSLTDPNSSSIDPNGRLYMALKHIAFRGEALVVTEDAPVIEKVPPVGQRPTAQSQSLKSSSNPNESAIPPFEAGITCPDGVVCSGRTNDPNFNSLVDHLKKALDTIDRRRAGNSERTAQDLDKVRDNFKESCGFPLEAFMPEVKRQADAAGMPSQFLLLSLAVQESSGHCFRTSSETDRTRNRGLFQINSNTAKYRACKDWEKQVLKKTPINKMRQGPKCLENPVLNLEEAIRVLKSKLEILTQPTIRVSRNETYKGFDPAQLKTADGHWSDEAWRLAVSAYNGGERWVLRAKHDLEAFNKKFDAKTDPYNWEDLRVFYLRRHLDRFKKGNKTYFDDRRTGRSEKYTLINLAYTENVVPRDRRFREGQATPLAELWDNWMAVTSR